MQMEIKTIQVKSGRLSVENQIFVCDDKCDHVEDEGDVGII